MMTWAEFVALVKGALSDRQQSDESFSSAVTEYVLAKAAQNRGDGTGYATHYNRYASMRKSLMGFETTLSDSQLKELVKQSMRDVGANNAESLFAAALADWVRSQRDPSDQVTAQRFATSRARLAGYVTTSSDATLQSSVRALLTDGKRDNTTFARACALYIRAEVAREVDSRSDETGGARAIYETCRADYERARLRLAGYSPTGGFSQTDVNTFLPVESIRANTSTYITALYNAAVEDLKAYGTWIDAQIAAGKAELHSQGAWIDQQVFIARTDLQSISDRVDREIRAGVIDLQRFVRAYTVGHTTTFVEADVVAVGHASQGRLPDGIQLTKAMIRRYTGEEDEGEDPEYIDQDCAVIDWDLRYQDMIEANECGPQIAIAKESSDAPESGNDGRIFCCTPQLEADASELIIHYNGTKLDFDDTDKVPFDEDAANAVAKCVNAALVREWGESVAQQQLWAAAYATDRTRCYLKHKRAGEPQA